MSFTFITHSRCTEHLFGYFLCFWFMNLNSLMQRDEMLSHRISSQSSLSCQPRLPSDTRDTLRTTIQPINQPARGQRSKPPSFTLHSDVTTSSDWTWQLKRNYTEGQTDTLLHTSSSIRPSICLFIWFTKQHGNNKQENEQTNSETCELEMSHKHSGIMNFEQICTLSTNK